MNAITYSQADRHAWPMIGSCWPHFCANASSATRAGSGLLAVSIGLRSFTTASY